MFSELSRYWRMRARALPLSLGGIYSRLPSPAVQVAEDP
jgi:hypothetical protein